MSPFGVTGVGSGVFEHVLLVINIGNSSLVHFNNIR